MAETLSESIFDHVLPEDFQVGREDFQKYVEEHQRQTLFIVDGFDEINKKASSVVQKLVQRRILPHSTVLMTSRPQYALHLLKHFDSRFVVNGYSERMMEEFVQKYATDMGVPLATFDAVLSRIRTFSSMKNLCRNPLNLCFLCILSEEREGDLPQSRTEIYDEIVSMLMQKASVRLDIPIEELEPHLQNLCQLAFHGLQNSVFSFPASSFTCEKVLASMGILNKEVPMSRLKGQVVYYVFTHKSFQDYLGARHVTSLSKEERLKHLFFCLRGRYMYTMWAFFCGFNRNNEAILMEFFTEFEKQFVPLTIESTTPGESRRWLHTPKNVPFHRLSIQDMRGGMHIQCCRCLKELDLRKLSDSLIEAIARCVPQQLTFSHLLISNSALTGLLNFLKVAKSRQYHFVISGQSFTDAQVHKSVLTYFAEIAKTGRVEGLGLHMVTSTSQLKIAMETFGLNKGYSDIKDLCLHFMSFVDINPEDFNELRISHGLESFELHDCNDLKLFPLVMNLVVPALPDLRKLVVQRCVLDQQALMKLVSAVKATNRLVHFDFTQNHIQSDRKLMDMLPLLSALEKKKSTLTFLGLAELPSRQALATESTIAAATEYLRNTLLKSNLEHFHISKAVLSRSLLEVLTEMVQERRLKSIETENCFIICKDAFNTFLGALNVLPELHHFSMKGRTVRSFQECNATEVEPPVFGAFDVSSLRSDMENFSPEVSPEKESPPAQSRLLSPPVLGLEGSSGPPSPRVRRRFISSRLGESPPQTLKLDFQLRLTRAISVPDGMHNKVVVSTANNSRSDDRTSSIHIIHDLLEKTRTLRCLVVSDLHTDQLICLCKGLEHNTSLCSLALLCSNFNVYCTSALSRFLEQHPSLQELCIGRSNFNSMEADPFFESVSKCKTLLTLGLNHCLFHDKYMPLLAKALKENLSIHTVLLRDNSRVTCEGVKVLHEGLKSRATRIRILDLSDCKVKRDDEIVERMKEVVLVVKVNWF